MAEALRGVGEVTVGGIGVEAEEERDGTTGSEAFPVAGDWSVQRDSLRGLGALVRGLRDPRFVNLHGVVIDPRAEAEVVKAVRKEFDLVWFFQLRTANYFRRACWERSVVDIDDLPSAKIGSEGALAAGFRQRLRTVAWLHAARVHERRLGSRFTVRAVCSEADREILGGDPSIHVIPNGFARPACDPVRVPAEPPRLGFIGLLDYEPNRVGVRWFLEQCWPGLRKSVPGLRFRLVGKGGEGLVTSPLPGVDVLGWVDDSGSEIASWAAMVIPIRSGAGTRIKIADTFSRKCPAISTRLGAYGYDVEDGRELRLADTSEDFGRACLEILRDPEGAAAMAGRAWRKFLDKWTWDAIAPRVRAAAEAALAR